MPRCTRALLRTLLVLLLAEPVAAASETDYLPDNLEWNGLSDLANIAGGMHIDLVLLEELDWSTLPPDATLLVIYPLSALDSAHVFTFLEGGGRMLLADDFGKGYTLLQDLRIQRFRGNLIDTDQYHDQNQNLPLARANTPHPLTSGVTSVVTNHPAYFRSGYSPLLGFAGGRQQLMVAGKLGRGRFVALADPSVLINGMLHFPGNPTLATNILKHLRTEDSTTFHLLTRHFRVRGEPKRRPDEGKPASAVQRFLSEYSDFLGRANDFAFKKTTFSVLPILAGGLALIALLVLLPLPRRPLRGHWLRPRGSIRWGAGGHLAVQDPQFRPGNAAFVAAVLRDEVEQVLTEILESPGPVFTVHPRWVTEQVRQLAGGEAAALCGKVLSSMRHVSHLVSREQVEMMRNIRQSDLANMYEQSRKLLQILGRDLLPDLAGPAADPPPDRGAAAGGVAPP